LRLWDGNSTEELVVAEDLLVSRDQISCKSARKRTCKAAFSPLNSFGLSKFRKTAIEGLRVVFFLLQRIRYFLQILPLLENIPNIH